MSTCACALPAAPQLVRALAVTNRAQGTSVLRDTTAPVTMARLEPEASRQPAARADGGLGQRSAQLAHRNEVISTVVRPLSDSMSTGFTVCPQMTTFRQSTVHDRASLSTSPPTLHLVLSPPVLSHHHPPPLPRSLHALNTVPPSAAPAARPQAGPTGSLSRSGPARLNATGEPPLNTGALPPPTLARGRWGAGGGRGRRALGGGGGGGPRPPGGVAEGWGLGSIVKRKFSQLEF